MRRRGFAGGRAPEIQNGAVRMGEPVRKLRREVLHPVVLGHALADVFVEVRSDVCSSKTQFARFGGDARVGFDLGFHADCSIVQSVSLTKLAYMLNFLKMRRIEFYRKQSGSCPVEEFIDSLDGKQAQKVVWVLDLVRSLGSTPEPFFQKARWHRAMGGSRRVRGQRFPSPWFL